MEECSSISSVTSISRPSCEMTEYHTATDMNPRSPHHETASAMEIMQEISQLEHEIQCLESYLLALYRSTFQKHFPISIENQMIGVSPRVSTDLHETGKSESSRYKNYLNDPTPLVTSNSIFGKAKNTLVCPSRLSEVIIRCIASIYCKLSSQKQTQSSQIVSSHSSRCPSPSSSPTSWSPQYIDDIADAFDFEVIKLEEKPYSSMFEVLELCSDNERRCADKMLQEFRFLVKNLECIDPETMGREEKLAFWINSHNALVMHGYLRYGTQSYTRSNLVMQVSYNVGGTLVTAYDIQNSILGIKNHSSTPWLQTLLSLRKKQKTGCRKHSYAIGKLEPLAHFGLSTGTNSDPAIRVYSACNIFEELKIAREEFIRSSIQLQDEAKLQLPKMLRYYAKDAMMTMNEVVDLVNDCLSADQQKAMRKFLRNERPEKFIHWLEPNSSFRYLIHQKLA